MEKSDAVGRGPGGRGMPNCRSCRHYFVTWEPRQPHGCRALGFKSTYMPHVHVLRTSGASCRLYDPRVPRG